MDHDQLFARPLDENPYMFDPGLTEKKEITRHSLIQTYLYTLPGLRT
jgi:hypothetical protein